MQSSAYHFPDRMQPVSSGIPIADALEEMMAIGVRVVLMDPATGGKQPYDYPYGRNWGSDPYTLEDVLGCNGPMAVDMGSCNLSAIDIDTWTAAALTEFTTAYPPIGIQESPRGFHLLYRDPIDRFCRGWSWVGRHGSLDGDTKAGSNSYLAIHSFGFYPRLWDVICRDAVPLDSSTADAMGLVSRASRPDATPSRGCAIRKTKKKAVVGRLEMTPPGVMHDLSAIPVGRRRSCLLRNAYVWWCRQPMGDDTDALYSKIEGWLFLENRRFPQPLLKDQILDCADWVLEWRCRLPFKGPLPWPGGEEHLSASRRGGYSHGISRRNSTADRDMEICRLRSAGMSMRKIAAAVGWNREGVRHVVRRDLG